jgi:hypothetical protein
LFYVNPQSFCLIGLVVTETFKECLINSYGTLGMFAGFHANTSALAHRKLMSAISYLGPRPTPILVVLFVSLVLRSTSLIYMALVAS